MPLWHAADFELNINKAQQDSGRIFTSLLTAYKTLDRGPGTGRGLSPEIATESVGKVCWAEGVNGEQQQMLDLWPLSLAKKGFRAKNSNVNANLLRKSQREK